MYVKVRELPDSVQSLLTRIGYGRPDISVSTAPTFSMFCSGGDGYRESVHVLNLANGEAMSFTGSWGGANMFAPSRSNPVDSDDTPRPILPNMVVVNARQGGGRPVYASLTVAPDTLVPLLPAPTTDLTDDEAKLLKVLVGVKPGEYRKQAIFGAYEGVRRFGRQLTEADYRAIVASLASKGLVKVNKAGAVTVTTEGKNARAALPKAYLGSID